MRLSTGGAILSAGRIVRVKRSVGGRARSSAVSAGGVAMRTRSSSRTLADSALSLAASAAAARLSEVTVSATSPARAASVWVTREVSRTSRRRSPGVVPRVASDTQATSRSVGASSGSIRWRLSAPPPDNATAASSSTVRSPLRVGRSSAPSTWWNCTGTAVWGSGITPSRLSLGALGLPGCSSTM